MRIIYMGTPEFAVPTLKALIDSQDEIVAVVSQPDRPKGRGHKVSPTPTKLIALEHGIPVLQPEKIKTEEFLNELKGYHPDMIVVAAYGKILPKSILDLPEMGCVNVHASLLPKYRGAAPINWAIVRGESVSGITTMLMDEGMDTGDMLLKKETPITHEDTGESLTHKLSNLGAELLIDTVQKLKGNGIKASKQPESEATYAPMLKREDGLVNWAQQAPEIRKLVRGMLPWPGAYTHFGEKMLKIYKSEIAEGKGSPGEVLKSPKGTLEVACGGGSLMITELQIEGGKRLDVKSFLTGRKIDPGMVLG